MYLFIAPLYISLVPPANGGPVIGQWDIPILFIDPDDNRSPFAGRIGDVDLLTRSKHKAGPVCSNRCAIAECKGALRIERADHHPIVELNGLAIAVIADDLPGRQVCQRLCLFRCRPGGQHIPG